MSKNLRARLAKLEGTRAADLEDLSDEDLDRLIELDLAALGGRELTAAEVAELEGIRAKYYSPDVTMTKAEEAEFAEFNEAIAPIAAMIAAGAKLDDVPKELWERVHAVTPLSDSSRRVRSRRR